MTAGGPVEWPVGFPYRPHLRFCSLGNENVAEVMESFRIACERLGYATSIEATPSVDNADINLFFFAMGLGLPSDEDLPPNAIVVNFEPALPELLAEMPGYRRLLQRAWVWEYSLENLMHHQALGILRSDYVPLTFEPQATPVMPQDQVLPDEAQDIDVIFFGETMPRRLEVLRALEAGGLRVAYPIGTAWTPAQRDALLPRAKVGLNMRKADRTATAEVPRLSILLRNRKAVVSELYPHSEIPAALRDAVEGCTKDELVERVRALVADAPRRRALEKAGPLALMRLPPQQDVLAEALRRYLAATRQRLIGSQAVTAGSGAAVSVLMVTRNDEANVVEALASMAAQTLTPHRIIVVDDASTDGTAALIRDRMRADPRLSGLLLLQTPAPMGWAAAAQWGLSHAEGDALALWSPGAPSEPNRLQVQSAFLQASPAVGAVGACSPSGLLPEMHPQILAGMLVHMPSDQQPMPMGSLMLAFPRIRQRGLGFDATLGDFAWMGLLLELVRDGALLANLNVALLGRPKAQVPAHPTAADVIALAHVRERLLPLVFPDLPSSDARRLARLYGQEWAPDASDATVLLRDMATACESHDDPHVATVLRGECLRVLDVYAQNARLAPGYIRGLMAEPLLRDFLAPLGERIYSFEPGGTS
ncbi:glycosyltransferase [Variovorax sp. ZS18.2.2]|uniref:glycosyltransferase family A protein n=1 Tax=Variovorax sp. ZS18.2.2 TaxID=2971255 RepID=UPI002150ADC1|nr:glycosyltransferase family A protein [Variovorax sp. ZS18.2.2]MCR6478309.1 glycosyltransferase [Variovorax sp. ZS18.2.2]